MERRRYGKNRERLAAMVEMGAALWWLRRQTEEMWRLVEVWGVRWRRRERWRKSGWGATR